MKNKKRRKNGKTKKEKKSHKTQMESISRNGKNVMKETFSKSLKKNRKLMANRRYNRWMKNWRMVKGLKSGKQNNKDVI